MLPEVGLDPTYHQQVAMQNFLQEKHSSIPTQLGGGEYV